MANPSWWGTYETIAADQPTYADLAESAATYGLAGWSGIGSMGPA